MEMIQKSKCSKNLNIPKYKKISKNINDQKNDCKIEMLKKFTKNQKSQQMIENKYARQIKILKKYKFSKNKYTPRIKR